MPLTHGAHCAFLEGGEEGTIAPDARVYLGAVLLVVRRGRLDSFDGQLVVSGDSGRVPAIELKLTHQRPHRDVRGQYPCLSGARLVRVRRNPAADALC
jgi:hypothetical protein